MGSILNWAQFKAKGKRKDDDHAKENKLYLFPNRPDTVGLQRKPGFRR
jgi:hypothetical protein